MITLLVAVFFVSLLGSSIAAVGAYLWMDYGHPVLGCAIVVIGLYVVFCCVLGLYFPWLPLSQWIMWI